MFAPSKRALSPEVLSSIFPWGLGGSLTSAGKKINHGSALKLSAFYCGVNIISDAVAVLPVEIARKEADSITKIADHPLTGSVFASANDYMSFFTLRKIMVVSALLKGDGFAKIIRNPATGEAERFQFIEYGDMKVFYNKAVDAIAYEFQGNLINPQDVIHIRGFSQNGIRGRSVIQYAADNMGVSLSAMEFAGQVYVNKGITKGVIQTESAGLKKPQRKAIAKAFSRAMNTTDPYRVAVLDDGLKYKKITISPQETEFIKAYAAGIEDIARWLNLPPHKLKDLTNSNYSNIYQMEQGFLGECLIPWVRQHEEEYTRKLLTTSERKANTYVNFDENAILRPDLKTKGEYARAMVLSGIFSQDEGRALVGKNPTGNPEHQKLLQPTNLFNQKQLDKVLSDE